MKLLHQLSSFRLSLHQRLLNPYNKSISSSRFLQTSAELVDDLQEESLEPISISYSKLLSNCCQSRSLNTGLQIHGHLTKIGLSTDVKHRNHLINLYSKCRFFTYARQLLEESPELDMVSWSALLSGYAQNGLNEKAISTFLEMHKLGVKCNEFSFPSVLKACSIKKDLRIGKSIHGIVFLTGFTSDVFVMNTLVVMYAKCGEIKDAGVLFKEIPSLNVVSWNAMFSCYVQNDFCGKAIDLFQEMVSTEVRPDEYSLSSTLNACTRIEDINRGKGIHVYLIKLGYDCDSYTKNALIDMYAKAGSLRDAIGAFMEIEEPDIVSWNSIIAGHVSHDDNRGALELLGKMKRFGIIPNVFTMSSALKANSGLEFKELSGQLHSFLIKMDILWDPFVTVGIIDMYCKCDLMLEARMIYEMMPKRDLVAANALICGYSHKGEDEQAISLFIGIYNSGVGFNETTLLAVLNSIGSSQSVNIGKQIHTLCVKLGFMHDVYITNSQIDAYGKCGVIEDAFRVFEECPLLDLASFTSMITVFSQCGQSEESMKLYLKMQDMELKPDSFVCSSLLNASANLSSLEQGKQIHAEIVKHGFISDVFAGNSLVNMYARCGCIHDAFRAFFEIPERGVVSWSAMIGGLAQHGYGTEAIEFFNDMLNDGIAPNNVTLVNVLYACNHAGLVTEAKSYFKSMKDSFGIEPTQEHYACMIDILSRAGKLNEAMEFLNDMPFEANASVWGALLGAAQIYKNVELAQLAANKLMINHPEKTGTHVLLANVYASAGMWESVANVRRLMKDGNVKKEPGMSWIEIRDKVYTFIVGDRGNPRSEEIYAKLDEMRALMMKSGYVVMVETDLHCVENNEKELLLSYHSEKLAVAFGLIATPIGVPIRVKKNLRICLDCHSTMKFISTISQREIIIRDINRFHHFRDGLCSCGDYW
ncbi:pentatricopeptide repeat-containing protein At5g04780, mitochondrial-like [Impatiens glandulifera]|uniref:pentatricopeptide repeat-containing protein At5g04780, mitochondrial-like n=1 Tax=Impatiens glandulifera TaxID=253017 RepID=UPI001FB0EF2C|nr:pentatricopeptide repeat-containing protein At5g04780, mitochondrial-like [Impatiens glandulifera]